MGFWKALAQVYGNTRQQRCWFHKTGNVLNCLPKAVQPKAKNALHQIWMAETRQEAYQAFDEFILTYELKFPKATASLAKDKEELLAFYDFPAEHWTHLRTTNPIESTFATVKLRTAKTRGCLSRKTMLTMVFQLCLSAQSRWRRLSHIADLERLSKTFVSLMESGKTRSPLSRGPYTTFDNNSAPGECQKRHSVAFELPPVAAIPLLVVGVCW